MIIGHGDIASVLNPVGKKDLLFFASGVSNSQEKNESEYEREKALLFSTLISYPLESTHIIYFSSLCVFYSNSRYAKHKLEMEAIIKSACSTYTIIRIGNISWGNNPNTLINFIRNKIKNNEPFEIRDEYRYIVDKDEFLHWIKLIPDWSCEMNIPGKRLKVRDVVDRYCRL